MPKDSAVVSRAIRYGISVIRTRMAPCIYRQVHPPSTMTDEPVIIAAPELARKTLTLAISSGSASRASGMRETCAENSFDVAETRSVISVRVKVGDTQTQRIPCGARSRAMHWGASRTGRHLMSLLSHFDMTVLLADPYVDAAELSGANVRLDDRDELAASADVISLHAPLTAKTRGMIDAAFLARMKPGATLVNTARGGLVDQDALIATLQAGWIFAILDVTEPEPLPADSPLLSLPNAFVTPHVAGAAGYETRRLADVAISEALRFHLGEPPLFEVSQGQAEQFG